MEVKDNETIGLKSIIIKYLLHWKLFLAAFTFSLIIAILYLIFYPKTYEMKAAVQIQEDKEITGGGLGLGEAAGLMKSFGLGGMGSGTINLEDELQIFQSNQLFRSMILELGLNVEYTKPYSIGYKLYNTADIILKADAETEAKLAEDVEFYIRQSAGKIKVKTETKTTGKKKFEFSELPAEIVLPQGCFVLDYSPWNTTITTSSIDVVYRPASHVAEDLLDEFLIEDYSKTANIIEITYTDHVSKRGEDMLFSLIELYNDQSYIYKKTEATKNVTYYDERIDSLVSQLLNIEVQIEKYKQNNRLTDISTDVMFYAEQMKEIQVKLLDLEAQSHAITLMMDFVKKEENRYSLVPLLLTLESGEKNPIVMYNELLLQRAQIMQTSKGNNPLLSALSEKIDSMRESVFLTISNASEAIRLSLDDLKKKEALIYSKMGDYPLQERGFVDLKRQQEILQGMYLLLLQKREESALNLGLEHDKARIIENPYVLSKSIAPRKLYAAIWIFLFSIFVPVCYLFIKEQVLELKIELRKNNNGGIL